MPRPRFHRLAAEKQAHILAVATTEFAEHGFDGASYNRIIEKAGLSKGAMYYYFDDKTDLYGTVVQAAFQQMMGVMRPREADDAESFWAAFRDDYRDMARFELANPEMLALIRSLAEHPERMRQGPMAEMYQSLFAYTEALIDRGQALGAVRTDVDRELLVSVAFAMGEAMDTWLLKRLDGLDDQGLERLTAQLIELYRRFLSP